MNTFSVFNRFGFSNYETSCYLALLSKHPSNGSQLSRFSGVTRSKIYDVLRNLVNKGFVFQVEKGLYAPLPPDELIKRVSSQFNSDLSILKKELNNLSHETRYEYIMTLKGYESVMEKAAEIIQSAKKELYLRLFVKEHKQLQKDITAASKRGVVVRYISMGNIVPTFDIQINHPMPEKLPDKIGGRSIDIIADKKEALVGIFQKGKMDTSPIIWTKNKGFVTTNRDSLKHDFYHFFLDKILEQKQTLSERELMIYEFIKTDD